MLTVEHYTDPGCPWAYVASPALAVLRWRYGEQLQWRLRLISITSKPEHYAERSLDAATLAQRYLRFRRFGVPFLGSPRTRVVPTATACRVVVAATMRSERLAERVLRALQLAWFNSTLLLDEPEGITRALAPVPDLDPTELLALAATEPGVELYEEHYRAARSEISPVAVAQGKTTRTDGPIRYTAPTLIFSSADGRAAVAGGYQPLEVYDALIANLEPGLKRRAAPSDALDAIAQFPDGLTTQELVVLIANGAVPNRADVEDQLIRACAQAQLRVRTCGNDVLWMQA